MADEEICEHGQFCPECDDGETTVRAGHLIDAERVANVMGEDYERRVELSATRVVYCPDCWRFWATSHL